MIHFDFTEGFVPKSSSKKLNYLLVAKPAVIAKAKFVSVYLFAPGQVGLRSMVGCIKTVFTMIYSKWKIKKMLLSHQL